jgi:sugar/nucleoside kinase (ribokinase family)
VSAPTWDVLVIGHPSIDIMFAGLPEWPQVGKDVWAERFGICAGTSFNTPAAANRLGLRVGYISMVGNDLWSRMVRDEYEAERLPTDFLLVRDRPMPFVSVAMNLGIDRGFVSHESMTADDERELQAFALEVVSGIDARHLHAYAAEEPPELFDMAKSRGMTVSFEAWGGSSWEVSPPLREVLSPADVVLANEHEVLAMTGEDDPRSAMELVAEIASCVVVKRGARGAMGMAKGEAFEVPAEPVDVVDTTGAGDCFNAGFLLGWLSDLPLEHCLSLGAICGAGAVGSFGGYRGCPRESELREIAAGRGIELPLPGGSRG